MEIYQSCGKFSITNNEKTAEVKTMLPNLQKGKYSFEKYYNVSNNSYYAIVAVLNMIDENDCDLRTYDTDKVDLKKVDPDPINLKNFQSFNGGKDFSNLQENDVIHFICYHDDAFDYDSCGKEILEKFQGNLPKYNIPHIDCKKKSDFQPKVGNGGILTFDGCQ